MIFSISGQPGPGLIVSGGITSFGVFLWLQILLLPGLEHHQSGKISAAALTSFSWLQYILFVIQSSHHNKHRLPKVQSYQGNLFLMELIGHHWRVYNVALSKQVL